MPTVHLRPELRLDRYWSLAATLGFSPRGKYTGRRWTAVVEPIFHPVPELGVSLAFGYTGLSVSIPGMPASRLQESVSRPWPATRRSTTAPAAAWWPSFASKYLSG
jgi:hypothetical protein